VIAEHTEEQASLYVLGLLSQREARAFEAAMAADPELAALTASLETGAAALAWTVPPRDPPPALRDRIVDRINRGEALPAAPEDKVIPFPRSAPWLPWAIAACVALMTAWLGYDVSRMKYLVDSLTSRDKREQAALNRSQGQRQALQDKLSEAADQLSNAERQAAASDADITSLRNQIADLQSRDALSEIKIATLASMLKNAPRAMAVVAWDPASQRGILQTLHMPPASADQDYQLWIIDPDYQAPVSAGVFDPAARSNFQPLHPIAKADKFAISLEKKGGSTEPQGPIVLVGE
jgi:anti-sigma-K factor RskA